MSKTTGIAQYYENVDVSQNVHEMQLLLTLGGDEESPWQKLYIVGSSTPFISTQNVCTTNITFSTLNVLKRKQH